MIRLNVYGASYPRPVAVAEISEETWGMMHDGMEQVYLTFQEDHLASDIHKGPIPISALVNRVLCHVVELRTDGAFVGFSLSCRDPGHILTLRALTNGKWRA